MAEYDEADPKQIRFAELIGSALSGLTFSDADRQELKNLGKSLNAKMTEEQGDNGTLRQCYWICDNNFACNPSFPPPNCNCHMVCF